MSIDGTPTDTTTVPITISVNDGLYPVVAGTTFNIEIEDNFCPRHLSANAIPDFNDATSYTGVKPGTLFDYQFKSNLFEEPDGDTMTYTACRVIDDNTCEPLPVLWGIQHL